MILEAPPERRHPIKLRGFGAKVWNYLQGVVHEGIEPPLELVGEGRAGTGKSMGAIGAVISFASLYPKVPGRVLIARLTRRSLTTSSCVTIRKLLPPGHPMLDGPTDDHRVGYTLGAWEFVLAGLDNVDNLLSTEWDIVLAEECRQFPKRAWEELAGRGLRNNALYLHDENGDRADPGQGVSPIPFGMIIGTTNPWTPKHYIRQRALAGKLEMVHTELWENPAYYDEQGYIQPMGESYDRRMRITQTGPRFKRLVLGLWCAAEGMIFEEFESELGAVGSNMLQIKREPDGWVSRETIKDLGITEFYAGVDYGDDAAGCLVVAGYTKKRELIVLAEVYARKKDLDWWEAWVSKIHARYPITLGFCDHNRDDWTRAFNDVVGAPREGPGQVFIKADKGVSRGLQIMRLRIARKTLFFDVDTLVHVPDSTLVEANLPTCTVDEIPEYIYKREEDEDDEVSQIKPDDVPDKKCHDHGCDATRYLCVGLDYFEPANRLLEPPNKAYRERLMHLHRHMGREYKSPEEIEDFMDTTDDDRVDTLRKSVWGDN